MAQVNVTINGHQYRMACLDGQEDHLMQLAQGLNQRIEDLRAKFGEIGDTRLTIMAAVMVADELFEATGKIRRLEHDCYVRGSEARLVATERAQVTEAAVAAAFASAAERIETVAKHLAHTPRPPATAPRRRAESPAVSVPSNPKFASKHAQGLANFGSPTLHWPGGAARCVRSHIPGALSILKGAVPDRARGLGHMAPTYFRREPGIDAPTAIAARTFL